MNSTAASGHDAHAEGEQGAVEMLISAHIVGHDDRSTQHLHHYIVSQARAIDRQLAAKDDLLRRLHDAMDVTVWRDGLAWRREIEKVLQP